MDEVMHTRIYTIPSAMLPVHRDNFNYALGELMEIHPELFFYCVELLLCTCHSHSSPVWYIDYYDKFVEDLINASEQVCIKDGGLPYDYVVDSIESSLTTNLLWRAYEGLARYIHMCVRHSIPRGYRALEVRDVDQDGMNKRIPIYVSY